MVFNILILGFMMFLFACVFVAGAYAYSLNN